MMLRRNRREGGQAIVELALFSIVLLYLVMGAADFGRMLFQYITVTQAAKDGARKGAAYPNCRSSITNFASVTTAMASSSTTYNSIDYAVAQAGQQLRLGSGNITVTYYTYDATTGVRTSGVATTSGQIDVTVTYPFTPITPLAGPIIGSIDLRATATHVIEAAPSGC